MGGAVDGMRERRERGERGRAMRKRNSSETENKRKHNQIKKDETERIETERQRGKQTLFFFFHPHLFSLCFPIRFSLFGHLSKVIELRWTGPRTIYREFICFLQL
jgi:hypothetical protein